MVVEVAVGDVVFKFLCAELRREGNTWSYRGGYWMMLRLVYYWIISRISPDDPYIMYCNPLV